MASDVERLRDVDPLRGVDLDRLSSSDAFVALAATIVAGQDPLADAGGERPPRERLSPLRQRPRTRVAWLAVTLASLVAAVVGALVSVSGSGAPSASTRGVTAPYTTPLRPARPLPAPWHPKGATGGTTGWMLVSDIVPAGWRLNTAGPAPGGLVCASLDACYVTGSSATRSSGPDDFASLYFSADGGNTWSVLALPDGFSFNWFSAMSCPAASVCYGAGTIRGTPVLISTDDGGQRWHVLPIAYRIAWLTCPEVGVCSGTTYGTPSDSNSVDDIPSMNHGIAFVHTVDAGVRWTSSKLPPADAVSGLACPSSTNCVVVAYPTDQSQGPGHFSGASLVTTDAGHTWASGRLPSGFGFDYISGVSCPDSAHCMALGVIAVPNPDQCRGGPPPPGFQGCSSGGTSIVSGVVTTADGGRTWRKRALPRDVPLPMISDVSCWSPGNCWLSGEEAVPQGNNGGSGLVLGTANDGASWTKVTFTVPAGAPEDVGHDSYMAVGSIRCPGSAGCIALGVSDQGSHSTPVYTFRRPVGAPGTR